MRKENNEALQINCDYCNRPAKLVSSKQFYGVDYGGNLYVCFQCDARVGCHKGGNNPLGSLANKQLRSVRMKAHSYFDKFWNNKGGSKRKDCYRHLAKLLNISVDDCHIASFNESQCCRVIEVCQNGLLEKAIKKA